MSKSIPLFIFSVCSSKEEFTIYKESGGGICDIYLFSDNNYPDFVQQWQPPCTQADILILSAHADDEFLMFGGTIPYYAGELDLMVQVAYLTTHWEEQPRPHELLDGLWMAGVENYPVIGIIADIPYQPIWTLKEALEIYDEEAVLEWFTLQIRRFKPSVIITHDVNGEYGHGAHKLAAKIVMDAVEISADPDEFPSSAKEYGIWDVPKTYLHFWEENSITMDWEISLDSFGGITAREAAELCYGCHKSQHVWGYSVNYGENWDCRQFGLYRTLVGTDEKADFMDHITPLSDMQQENDETEQTSAKESAAAVSTEALTAENATESVPEPQEQKEVMLSDNWNILLIGIIFCAACGLIIFFIMRNK